MKCRTCGTPLSAGALLCGECGTSAIAPRPTLGDTAHHDRAALLAAIRGELGSATRAPARTPARTAAPAAPAHPAAHPADLPQQQPRREQPTRAHAAPRTGATFSLVFSTGESVRVSGSGLVGRNPVPAPDEHIDYLVQIIDPQRSVSKTHLEFGVDGEQFWVRDRGSANGTRLGADTGEPVELAAGEWTIAPRGTRIGIGDEHLDVH
ncbi:FHA domain-containing protein [Herbiconiux sp. KACC 21604]|uniref:FHA domain-containing protein n=1 Tax=unclassified Herbiconiux TaxID=2618217 RepID=UPI001492C296|nr:FHA domain-containing protein [Herbiconiux sp. SALV-R1]QJU53251.1 FHA domain-containing protein [Herbiconiux sp. SALV-R1]WPO88209.1 FHA domain-containing protein [Herbiconiux sp. KACC 21604]